MVGFLSIENKGIKHQSPRHNIVDQEVTERPEFLRFRNRCQEDVIDDPSDEDGHSYTTLVTQEFGVSRRIPFFEVIDDKENQTRKDKDIGQNSVIEQHAPTIIMDLDRNSY